MTLLLLSISILDFIFSKNSHLTCGQKRIWYSFVIRKNSIKKLKHRSLLRRKKYIVKNAFLSYTSNMPRLVQHIAQCLILMWPNPLFTNHLTYEWKMGIAERNLLDVIAIFWKSAITTSQMIWYSPINDILTHLLFNFSIAQFCKMGFLWKRTFYVESRRWRICKFPLVLYDFEGKIFR